MKKLLLHLICLLPFAFKLSPLKAQEYVVDQRRLASVEANQAVRMTAEQTHHQLLVKINANLDKLNTNVSAVLLAQTIIYNGLANVNSALKNGLAFKNIASITGDIIYYLGEAMQVARDDPALFLFVAQYQNELGPRITALVSDVSGFILKSGDNVLADYNSRDQLLKRVTTQLQIIDALAYGAWRSMYWAAERGLLRSLNPFSGYISRDKNYAEQIIQNAKYLRK